MTIQNPYIEKPSFYYSEIDQAIEIDLAPDRNGRRLLETFPPHTKFGFKGLQWGFKGRVIRIRRCGVDVHGWPSPAMDKFVVVYPRNDKHFPRPNNLVIYNPDGSLHMRPEIPLSCAPKDTWPYTSPIKPLSYLDVHWTKYEGKITMAIDLELGLQDAIETRIFNPYTGECEDFLYTWKL